MKKTKFLGLILFLLLNLTCMHKNYNGQEIASAIEICLEDAQISSTIKVDRKKDSVFIQIHLIHGFFLAQEARKNLFDFIIYSNEKIFQSVQNVILIETAKGISEKVTYKYTKADLTTIFKTKFNNGLFKNYIEISLIKLDGENESSIYTIMEGLNDYKDSVDYEVYQGSYWQLLKDFAEIPCDDPAYEEKFLPYLADMYELAGPKYFDTKQDLIKEIIELKEESCK